MWKKCPVFSGFLPVLAVLSCLCGCTRSAAQTPASLLREIEAGSPAYALPAEALFYKDGVYFGFYSLHEENDLLLTMRVNERQQIVRAAVTAKKGSEAANRDLAPFGLLLSRLLLPESDPDRLAAATGLSLLPRTPADALNVYPCKNHRAALFCGVHALCFFVELRASAETESAETMLDSPEVQIPSPEFENTSANIENSSSETENFSSEAENFSQDTP